MVDSELVRGVVNLQILASGSLLRDPHARDDLQILAAESLRQYGFQCDELVLTLGPGTDDLKLIFRTASTDSVASTDAFNLIDGSKQFERWRQRADRRSFANPLESLVANYASLIEQRMQAPRIERAEASDEAALALTRSTEHLLGQVEILLHDVRAWEDTPDVELDVENSVRSLRDEIARPVEGTDLVMVERLSVRLSHYVVEYERSTAKGDTADALGKLEESVLDVMAAMDGTNADVSAALAAVDGLAGLMAFRELERPDDVDVDLWDEFVEEAEANPVAVLHESFEWRTRTALDETKDKYLPLRLGEVAGISSLAGAAIVAGISGSALAIAGAGSAIAAVVGVLLATFTANFRRAGRDEIAGRGAVADRR